MQQSITSDLRRTATGVVDVVTLHGDHVVRTVKENTPIMMSIASSGIVGDTIDIAVGYSDAVVSLSAEDDVLATNTGGLVSTA
jgi:hypothetical protein